MALNEVPVLDLTKGGDVVPFRDPRNWAVLFGVIAVFFLFLVEVAILAVLVLNR